MSAHPKPRKASPRGEPTTVEPYAERRQNVWPYSDNPTGEWTAERFRECGIQSVAMAEYLADEVNTKLAAANEDTEKYRSNCLYWKEQLAAERERANNAEARYASLHTMEADALREQLAAEREKVKKWEDESDRRDIDEADYRQKMVAEIQARDKQLAAEREKWDKLADEPLTHAIRKADIEIQQLRSQVQTLVDALHQIGLLAGSGDKGDPPQLKLDAIAKRCQKELAKVKEGK